MSQSAVAENSRDYLRHTHRFIKRGYYQNLAYYDLVSPSEDFYQCDLCARFMLDYELPSVLIFDQGQPAEIFNYCYNCLQNQ